jgi:hypothetical protein
MSEEQQHIPGMPGGHRPHNRFGLPCPCAWSGEGCDYGGDPRPVCFPAHIRELLGWSQDEQQDGSGLGEYEED